LGAPVKDEDALPSSSLIFSGDDQSPKINVDLSTVAVEEEEDENGINGSLFFLSMDSGDDHWDEPKGLPNRLILSLGVFITTMLLARFKKNIKR